MKQTLQQMQQEFQDNTKITSNPVSPPTDDTIELCNGSKAIQTNHKSSSSDGHVETDI